MDDLEIGVFLMIAPLSWFFFFFGSTLWLFVQQIYQSQNRKFSEKKLYGAVIQQFNELLSFKPQYYFGESIYQKNRLFH